MRATPARALAVLVSACLSACDCVAYTRGSLPAPDSADYRAIVAHLDRAASDVIVIVDNHDLAHDPVTASALRQLGLVTTASGRIPAFTSLAKRVSVDKEIVTVVVGDAYVRLAVGKQHVERLVSHVASHGAGYCLPDDDDDDEYGYVARVDSLNALGKALLAKKLLRVGFARSFAKRWDGREPIIGAIASIVPHGVDPPFDVDDRLGETMSIGSGG